MNFDLSEASRFKSYNVKVHNKQLWLHLPRASSRSSNVMEVEEMKVLSLALI